MNEVKRPRTVISIALLVALVAIVVGGIALAGGGDEETTTSPPAEAPSAGTAPPSVSALPPEFVECMEDQGIDAESIPDQIHSPEGDACFESLHGGGG
jgi:hypothetical protein